jgi:hypothetical protein
MFQLIMQKLLKTFFSFKIHLNKKHIMEFGHTLGIVRKISIHKVFGFAQIRWHLQKN